MAESSGRILSFDWEFGMEDYEFCLKALGFYEFWLNAFGASFLLCHSVGVLDFLLLTVIERYSAVAGTSFLLG